MTKTNDDLICKDKPEKRPYCSNCRRHVGYKIDIQPTNYETDGVMMQYNKIIAVCARCQSEIPVPVVNDLNCQVMESINTKE